MTRGIRSPLREPTRSPVYSPSTWKWAASGTGIIELSNNEIEDDAQVNDLVGILTVSGGSGPYTFSITADADVKFVLDNADNTRLELQATVDHATAPTHNVTIQATNGVDSPLSRTFTIVVNEPVLLPLSALSLDNLDIDENSAAGTVVGAITGKTAGSTLSMFNSSSGRFALSGTSIVAGQVATDHSSATSHSITIRETLVGSPNSPLNSVITITVNNVAPVLSSLAVTPVSPYTTATISVDSTDGDGTIYFVIVPTAQAAPNSAQIVGGQNASGTAATWAGNVAVSGIDTYMAGPSGLTADATYDCYAIHYDVSGVGSNVVTVEFLAGATDITAPTLSSSTPADNATGVSSSTSIVLTFSEAVLFNYPGGGTLTTKLVGGATVETFTPSSTTAATGSLGGTASISSTVLTITPGASLAAGAAHCVRIAADCIEDASANAYAGIVDDTTLSFTTTASSTRQYTISGFVPLYINENGAGREAMHGSTYVNGV